VDSLIPEFEKEVVFIMADLQTPKGRAFALRHNVPNTVLVFFDPKGRRIATLYGVQERQELRQSIIRILDL
jgi:hypothetical protein